MTTIQVRTYFWSHVYSMHSITESNKLWCMRHGIDSGWTYDASIPCIRLSFDRDTDLTVFRLRYGEFEI